MFKVFIHHAEKVMSILDKAANSGEVIDLQQVFFRYGKDAAVAPL